MNRSFLTNAFVWILPCFFLWLSFITPIIGQVGINLSIGWLSSLYPEHNLTLSVESNPERWFINSSVFQSVTGLNAGDDGSKVVLDGKTKIQVQNMKLFSLPLALFILFAICSEINPLSSLNNALVISTLGLLCITLAILGIGISMLWQYTTVLADVNANLLLINAKGTVTRPTPFNEEIMWVIRSTTTCIYLCNVIVLPFYFLQYAAKTHVNTKAEDIQL